MGRSAGVPYAAERIPRWRRRGGIGRRRPGRSEKAPLETAGRSRAGRVRHGSLQGRTARVAALATAARSPRPYGGRGAALSNWVVRG